MDNPDQLRDEILKDVDAADSVDALEDIRVSVLGKKGRITDMMKGLGQMDPDARKAAGQALNALKDEIAGALETKKTQLADADLDRRLMTEKIDVTLPPAPEVQGTIHPISQTIDEITEIFGEMGFTVAEGPDIEDDWHNFTALNIPENHPARAMHRRKRPIQRIGHPPVLDRVHMTITDRRRAIPWPAKVMLPEPPARCPVPAGPCGCSDETRAAPLVKTAP